MGFYINPADGSSKEEFIEKYGKPLFHIPSENFDFVGSDSLPVCWVVNNGFTAACIVYCARELHAFCNPSDTRPKSWFLIKKEHLEEEAGMWKGWIKDAQEEVW